MLILDDEGQRIYCKYYANAIGTNAERKEFELKLFTKTSKNPTGTLMFLIVIVCIYGINIISLDEIVALDNFIIPYSVIGYLRFCIFYAITSLNHIRDVYFYVVGTPEDNEIGLLNVLNAITGTLDTVLKYFFCCRSILLWRY